MPSLPTIQPEDVRKAEGIAPVGAFDAPAEDVPNSALFECLRLGDDSLVLGQRLTEWCGHAPAVEVDLSLANLGLDLFGQATLFLGYAGEVEGRGRDADKLAFHRDVLQFRNCLMVEQPNGDFAQTMARHFLFSIFQLAQFERLAQSKDARLAGIAAKAAKEVRYHVELSGDWVVRLGDGTEESRRRMLDGLDWHWRFVDELFQMDELEQDLVRRGIAVDRAALRPGWDAHIGAVLKEAGLPEPKCPSRRPRRAQRHHSEHLGYLLAVMQYLPHLSGRALVASMEASPARPLDEAAVRAALADVPDPEIPVVSLVDLGILRGVQRDPPAVLITPTYTGCPATAVIELSVRAALDQAGFRDVPIKTVLTPAWTTDWITDQGREALRGYGIAPPPRGQPARSLRGGPPVECPRCGSTDTVEVSRFGSTPCKAQWRCRACHEPFDAFKCH